ncbi:universal stress protein [Pseudomonas sp. RA_35y_Pfl2_P32]|uniref:universal stress protein n=1 Tax=Pseudomonas sp. RA_35y_Pfl2_P32 TaxID=3088705 RepID=UPI0030DDA2F8
MSQYQRLLLIINPALRQSPAIHQAGALAGASGASLHIVGLIKSLGILTLLEGDDWASARASYLQEQDVWLQAQADQLRASGVEVTAYTTWSEDVKSDILEHVSELQPDLLIKQVQQEPLLKRTFFTPMDWHLLRYCPVPTYLVGDQARGLPRKIVAAIDSANDQPQNQKLNERILKQAERLALQCDAELHLITACDITADFLGDLDGAGLALSDLTRQLRQDLENAFLNTAEHFGVAPERRHFIKGDPVQVLAEFAHQHQVDVLVLGRNQSRGLEKLIGSTTEHLLYQASCSVLAV